jgi:hypothetical protein
MNLLDLRNAVKDRLAIRSDGSNNSLDGLITNAYVNTSIDDALNRVSMERDWWWLATTASLSFDIVDGDAPLPADFMRANKLVINDYPVEPLPLDTFLDPNADSNAYGWLVYGNAVKITPIPTTTTPGTLYYFRSEPALSTQASPDTKSPLMPVVYHKSIVAYASHLCAARRQDEQRAALYLQEYGNFLKSMSDDNRATIHRRIKFSRAMSDAAWS